MDEKVLIALVAAGSAVVGGLLTAVVSPWIKYRLERVTNESARKREQIQRWRAMVSAIASACEDDASAAQALQMHPDYLGLEPLLSEEARRAVYRRNFVATSGQSLPYVLEQVKHGIAEVEKKWRLQ
jgi:hypothetical protein